MKTDRELIEEHFSEAWFTHRQRKRGNKMYAITNAYAVQDSLKANGATWDAGRKAWIVTDAVFAKLQARTRSFGMSWATGWAKAVKVKIEEASTPDWQNDPKCGFVE